MTVEDQPSAVSLSASGDKPRLCPSHCQINAIADDADQDGAQLGPGIAAAVPALSTLPARALSKEIRLGFQKYGTLVLLKGKGLFEENLGKLGHTTT